DKKLDDLPFWMTGEVFNYFALAMGRVFNGDGFNVDYYNNGFENLIDFGFRFEANNGLETLFSNYSNLLQNQLFGGSAMNFLTNHDTQEVFDRNRTRTFEAGTKLLLSPSTAQIYYGDETARTLTPGGGVTGDATLRSFMNFGDLTNQNSLASLTLLHYNKIGKFRREHVSVGAGVHSLVQNTPYAFKREYDKNGISDKTLVYSGNDGDFTGSVDLFGLWSNGTELTDYFSGNTAIVSNGFADFNSSFGLLLIGEAPDSDPPPPSSFVVNAKKPNDWGQINAYIFNNKTNSVLQGTPGWPGQTMGSLSGSSAWNTLTINVPSGVSTDDISMVFNNNNNGSQTVDLTRNRDGWFEFTSGGAVRNGVWTDTCPSDCPGNGSNTFRIFAQKPFDWGAIYTYAFNTSLNTTLSGTSGWPGQQMTQLSGTNDWYFYDIVIHSGVSASEIGIVFNNNNAGSQSADLVRDREGWFNFTSGGAIRSGSWSDNCPFDCPSASLTAILDLDDSFSVEDTIIAFPNPSSGQGDIQITLSKKEKVAIVIYDFTGRVVQDVFKGEMAAGLHTLPYNLTGTGTYLYTIRIGDVKKSGKLVVQ
ncbi:MAG: starch-binding protein, partial [Bacteroidota bacterium]